MAIKVTKEGNRWIARFPFDYATKDVVKAAGFTFDGTTKLWSTTDPVIAARLDPRAAEQANQNIAASRAVNGKANIPAPPGLAYMPFQLGGINYMLDKDGVLLGDEMGLGKTVQAAGLINADPTIKSVLVVSPASLKINWARELQKWLVRPMSIGIVDGVMSGFGATNIVIINYDILAKNRAEIDARSWDLLIADECHYAKNPKAQRTQALIGKRSKGQVVKTGIRARRRLFLTGTPIVNRPSELFPLLEALDPNDMGKNFFRYAQRYCGAYHNGYGWDFTGASNLDELQTRMRAKFMVRRLKSEVLTELPAKRRQVVVVPPPSRDTAKVIAEERAAYDKRRKLIEAAEKAAERALALGDKEAHQEAVRQLHKANGIAFEEMSRERHRTAVAKIPSLIEHLEAVLEETDKVVVFIWHHDVAHALKEHFPTAAVVTGETKVSDRTLEVDRFQNDPDCRVFVGSIKASGVGLTLTAAQHVVFGELDWVPGNVSQAEDRLHRIGQQGSVLVQHLVFDNSVDAIMAQTIITKQEVIDAALDDKGLPVIGHTPPVAAPPLIAEPDPRNRNTDDRIPYDAMVPF